jgi:hypothetical protein
MWQLEASWTLSLRWMLCVGEKLFSLTDGAAFVFFYPI